MRKLLLFITILSFSLVGVAQNDFLKEADKQSDDRKMDNDPKAQELLDEVSATFKGYQSLKSSFTVQIADEREIIDTYGGVVYLKGDKFRLETDDAEIISNGVKKWVYLKESNEVQISYYDPNGETIESPSQLFTLYERDFYFYMNGTANVDGKEVAQVKLIPTNVEESDYTHVILHIDREQKRIVQAVIHGRDGVQYTWQLKDFETGIALSDELFNFNAGDYPDDIYIDDMTN